MDDRYVVHRQDARIRQIDRLPTHLHGELGGANHGRTNTLARLDDRNRETRTQLRHHLLGQDLGDVAVIDGFSIENIFGDAAGKCQELRHDGSSQWLGEFERVTEGVDWAAGYLIDGEG